MERPYVEQGQPYRLSIWLARWSLMANAVQTVLILILSASLVVLAHRDNIRPFFVTADIAANRVFRVEPVYGNVQSFDLVTQAIARRYVILRETLDFATEESRWLEASWLAAANVSEQFKELMVGKSSPLQAFKSRHRTRAVVIISSPLVSNDGGTRRTHLVEFKTIDTEPGQREEKTWQATVVTEARDADIKLNDALLNPYGVTVISYTIAPKKV